MKNFLEEFIDIEKSNIDPQFNLDEPESCDLCGKSFSDQEFFIDGEVKGTNEIPLPNGQSMGEWAYMCSECFKNRGVAIKWGQGQLFQKTLNNEWLLVGGFPPNES